MMPSGYQPHTRRSPLTDPWEPLLSQQTADALYLALEIREAHCNARGFAHGGLISALADNAMGHSAVLQTRRRAGSEKASAVTCRCRWTSLTARKSATVLNFSRRF